MGYLESPWAELCCFSISSRRRLMLHRAALSGWLKRTQATPTTPIPPIPWVE